MLVKKTPFVIVVICLFGFKASAQKEPFTSRIYFPALVGLNFTTNGNAELYIKKGITLNTAIEYRPTYVNSLFYRFNYDALTDHYHDRAHRLHSNVKQGTLHTTFFDLGTGYRRKFKKIGLYLLLQPGIAIQSFDQVAVVNNGYSLTQVKENSANLKITTGAEYYIVPHFAIIAEPAYYRLFNGDNKIGNSVFGISVGFTTTLF